jgi:hypothetical protein
MIQEFWSGFWTDIKKQPVKNCFGGLKIHASFIFNVFGVFLGVLTENGHPEMSVNYCK